jgi:hypothetical protein
VQDAHPLLLKGKVRDNAAERRSIRGQDISLVDTIFLSSGFGSR